MNYSFYNDLLKEISLMLNYQAAVNILANAYAGKESIDMVHNSNPMNVVEKTKTGGRKKATLENLKALK